MNPVCGRTVWRNSLHVCVLSCEARYTLSDWRCVANCIWNNWKQAERWTNGCSTDHIPHSDQLAPALLQSSQRSKEVQEHAQGWTQRTCVCMGWVFIMCIIFYSILFPPAMQILIFFIFYSLSKNPAFFRQVFSIHILILMQWRVDSLSKIASY